MCCEHSGGAAKEIQEEKKRRTKKAKSRTDGLTEALKFLFNLFPLSAKDNVQLPW